MLVGQDVEGAKGNVVEDVVGIVDTSLGIDDVEFDPEEVHPTNRIPKTARTTGPHTPIPLRTSGKPAPILLNMPKYRSLADLTSE